jgi:tetratricopeptide (TPR) repeat protein
MPTFPLRLIPAAVTQPVRAGFLPGSDVAAWLEEMSHHPGARFFIVPSSVEEAAAGGLLIIPASGRKSAVFGPRVMPCALEHGSVAVPSSMRLDPALTAEEARRLLQYAFYFFHPALGLVAFEETDAITAEALIVPPLARETSWLQASHGHSSPPRLARVMLILPEELDDLFGDAAQDIGSLSPKDLQTKAPLLERLRDKLVGGAAIAGLGMLGALGGLAKMLGAGKGQAGSAGPGSASPGATPRKGSRNIRGIPLMDRLMQWTAEQFEKLQRKREHELQRLMKLLETNPELGLRYALPFGGGGDASRGQAPPGWKLGERNPVFGSRRGGGPADVWDLAPQTQWQLQQKYRELANREIAAGRFDRAAYIFAELLGDWHAAAGALARGRRHQEAAKIYLTKLNNKPLAAKCLEDGGLIADAVLLYGELGQHEKCGDLLRQIGREREAVAAYHEAIKNSSDRLHDARILFEKLQQHGLAISVLASGYPHSTQACQCLERHFDYLARLDAVPEALALSRSLGDPARQVPDRVQMTETLRTIHQSHADPEVRQRLSRVATGIIGEALAAGTSKEAPLLAALPQFAAADLLLKRDSLRFADARERARRQERKVLQVGSSKQALISLSHQGSLTLPKDGTEWWRLIRAEDKWLAIGQNDKTRQDVWVYGQQNRILGKFTSASGWAYLTHLSPALVEMSDSVWLPFARKGEMARYGQARLADFCSSPNTRDMLMDQLSWVPQRVLAVHPQSNGVWIVHHNATETIDLSFYSRQGQLIRSHALGWAPPELSGPICLAVHGHHVMLSAGTHLLRITNGAIISQTELPSRILSLHATQAVQPAAFLAVTSLEVVLLSPGKNKDIDSVLLFTSPDKESPKACFLNDGRIAVGDDKACLIYSAHPETRLLQNAPLQIHDKSRVPSAVCFSAWGDKHIAVLNADGVIDWFS